MGATRDVLDALPPWDAFTYFENVKESPIVIVNGNIGTLADFNLRRVALIFHVAGSGTVNVGLLPTAQAGITCASTLPPTELRFADYGPLVCQHWQAFNPGAQPVTVTVYEVVLLRWPKASVTNGRSQRARPKRAAKRPGNGG